MLILVLLMHAAFATIFPIGRYAVTAVGPVFFSGIRMLAAGVILLVYYRIYRGSIRHTLSPGGVIALATSVLCTMYATNTFESFALQTVPAGKAAFLYTLSPFYVAILSYFVFGERLTRYKVIGMSIGFIGFMLMVYNDSPTEISKGGWWIISTGEVLMVIAAISAAIGGISMRQLIRVHAMPPLLACGISMVLGGLCALMTSPLIGEVWSPLPVTDYNIFFTTFVLGVAISNLIGYGLFFYLVQYYSVTLLYFAIFTETGFAALMGWWFLGETLTWPFYVSSVLVLVGIYLFYQDELRGGHMLEKVPGAPS